MSRKIIGNAASTPMKPEAIAEKIKIDDHMDNETIHVTLAEKQEWNNKSNFSGSYNDLTDIPEQPQGTGVSISKVEQTTTSTQDDGINIITVTKTDGTKSTFQVKNGSKGSVGVGIRSIAKTGTNGLVDTYTITFTDDTKTTFTVTNGSSGSGGTGYTPQKGVDYWTAEDIAQIKSYVDEAILGGAW